MMYYNFYFFDLKNNTNILRSSIKFGKNGVLKVYWYS